MWGCITELMPAAKKGTPPEACRPAGLLRQQIAHGHTANRMPADIDALTSLEERAQAVHRSKPKIAEPCHHLLAGSIRVQRRAHPVRCGLAVVIVPFGCSVGFWGHGAIHH